MSNYQVLIVDDQREVARMLHAALETLGHNFVVTLVPSGEEAFLEARLKKYDLLIADLRLPGISGLELMNRLRARTPDLKVIMMTGQTDSKSKRQVAEAGANAFFYKPIEIPDFLDTVERILGLVDAPGLPLVDEVSEEAARAIFIEDDESDATDERALSKRLARLRQEASATATLLLDDHGQILAVAGDLPKDDFEQALIPSLMAAFSAGQRISAFLGQQTPLNLQVFDGVRYDLALSAVSISYVLLVIGEALAGDLARTKVIFEAIPDFQELLAKIGVNLVKEEHLVVQPPFTMDIDEIEQEPQVQEDDALVALLDQAPSQVPTDSLDDFWSMPEKVDESSQILDSGVITYEQALRLGLAPEEKNKK